jgi:adenine deaminase
MSLEPAHVLAARLGEAKKSVRTLGCGLDAPFMSLSFLALPVIPELKLTDLGLVDVTRFEIVDLFVD